MPLAAHPQPELVVAQPHPPRVVRGLTVQQALRHRREVARGLGVQLRVDLPLQLLRNGVRFGLIILRIVTLFSPLRVFFPIFLALEALALAAYFWSIANGDRWLHIPQSTGIFFLGGIIIFLFGLISEQIASLRFKGPER